MLAGSAVGRRNVEMNEELGNPETGVEEYPPKRTAHESMEEERVRWLASMIEEEYVRWLASAEEEYVRWLVSMSAVSSAADPYLDRIAQECIASKGEVERLISPIARNPALVSYIVDQAVERVVMHADRHRGEQIRSVKVLLLVAARNLLKDAQRKKLKADKVETVSWDDEANAGLLNRADDSSAEGILKRIEAADLKRIALGVATDEEKKLFRLWFDEDMAPAEISRRMGVSSATVLNRMDRLFEKVRSAIHAHSGEMEDSARRLRLDRHDTSRAVPETHPSEKPDQTEETSPDLQEEFRNLVEQWRRETMHISSTTERATNFAYQQIIGMGEKVLPLIFRELQETGGHWFWALRAITRQNPVPPEARGNINGMAQAWLEWGRQRGYV